jgi:uncharacterized membrane protein YidH (DUF202 family)
MQDPEKKPPVFGSEVLRLETPEHRKHRRRRSLIGTIIFLVMSVNLIYSGIDSMQTGKWVLFHKSLTELPGWLVLVMGLLILVYCIWQFIRYAANKD